MLGSAINRVIVMLCRALSQQLSLKKCNVLMKDGSSELGLAILHA